MLVGNLFVNEFADLFHFRFLLLGGLNQHHGQANQSSLSDKVNRVRSKRLQDINGTLKSSSSTRDTKSKASTVSDVRVVAFSQKGHDLGALFRLLEQDKSQGCDSSSSDVIRDITDSNVEQSLDSRVVGCSAVSKSNGVHSTISEDRVLVQQELFDEGICLFLTAVHHQGNTKSKASNDLLVLGFVGVDQHFFNSLGVGCSKHDKTHANTSGFTGNSAVHVKNVLQVIIDWLES
mmetsp:Transcript_18074/g.25270  ORF Transcript_18074/g.25270 Transcript_18074/m.25270 type:complete len:234 (-) Transcript_18074:808-1509(-)